MTARPLYQWVVTKLQEWLARRRRSITAPNWYAADVWAARRGWFLDPHARAALATRLTRRRNYALIGAAPGILLAGSGVQHSLDDGGVAALYLAAAGALAGLVVAAVQREAPARPRRAAWVAPRRGRDYAPRFAVVGSWILAVVSLAQIAAVVAIRLPDAPWLRASIASIVVVAVVGSLHLALHLVAHKPLPAANASDIAIDDGLRREAAHAVAGGVLAFFVLMVFGSAGALFKEVMTSAGVDSRWSGFGSLVTIWGAGSFSVAGVVLAVLAWRRTTQAGVDVVRERATHE